MNKEMFDLEGPQLASVEAGKEPSLREIIIKYYQTVLTNMKHIIMLKFIFSNG